MKKKETAADKIIICRPDYGTPTAQYFANMEEAEATPEPETIEEEAPNFEEIEDAAPAHTIQGSNFKILVTCNLSGLTPAEEEDYYKQMNNQPFVYDIDSDLTLYEQEQAHELRQAERNKPVREALRAATEDKRRIYGRIHFADGRRSKNKFIGYWFADILQVVSSYEGVQILEAIAAPRPSVFWGLLPHPTEKSRYYRIISGDKIYYCIGKGAAQKFREEKDERAEISEIYLSDKEADARSKQFYAPRVVSKVIKRK